jgi:hypothetical protein
LAFRLDACKNTAELARQIAECCCETQKAILAQSASIRELDLSIENKRLQALVCHTQNNASNSNIEIIIQNALGNALNGLRNVSK